VFGDLRKTEFRDDWFDVITYISTIEHVGMDNAMYTNCADIARPGDTEDFVRAIAELKRVLKRGGVLYVTCPFGRYENHGFFQQFDSQLVDKLIEAFASAQVNEAMFRDSRNGWILSDRDACTQCEYFDVHESKYFMPASTMEYPSDYAAGPRAVACLELQK
jgi:SAM-dependent methyltransferase